MTKEQATALLGLVNAQPDAFAQACADAAGEGDPEALAEETVAALSGDAGSETEEDIQDA
jgi:hypothetical protein